MNCIKKFSRIVCVSLFSYQGCFAVVFQNSLFILSHVQVFVNNFFEFLLIRKLKAEKEGFEPSRRY